MFYMKNEVMAHIWRALKLNISEILPIVKFYSHKLFSAFFVVLGSGQMVLYSCNIQTETPAV